MTAPVQIGAWVLAGGVWKRRGYGNVTPPPPPSSIPMRFPGDPNPRVNGGRLYWGMSSDDASGWTTLAQFEAAIAKPLGVHHYYDNGVGISSIAVPNGSILTKAQTDLAAGRLPLGSTHVPGSEWQAAGNGTFDSSGTWTPDPAGGAYDTQLQAFIGWCETPGNLSGPLFWVVNHEPDAGNNGAGDGNPVYYRSWMNRVRWNLNKWETDNGRARTRLVLLTCHTAFMWAKPAAVGSLGTGDWWPGDHVPDVVGVDCYAEHSSTTWSATDSVVNSSNFKAFHNFVTSRGLTWALTEWGVLPANTNGRGVLKETYDFCTDGTQDCVLLAYFNSGWWHLNNNNGTLPEAKAEALDAKSIHLSDLGY